MFRRKSSFCTSCLNHYAYSTQIRSLWVKCCSRNGAWLTCTPYAYFKRGLSRQVSCQYIFPYPQHFEEQLAFFNALEEVELVVLHPFFSWKLYRYFSIPAPGTQKRRGPCGSRLECFHNCRPLHKCRCCVVIGLSKIMIMKAIHNFGIKKKSIIFAPSEMTNPVFSVESCSV